MSAVEGIRFRRAGASDSEHIARLHAESWRRHYRGAYSDAYLDGDVIPDRLSVWGDRLRDPSTSRCTLVADDAGTVVGFAHTALDDDPRWGALLDNLHVAHTHQRRGIGAQLLALSGAAVADARPGSGLYLWVLEQNRAAQAFYARMGARPAGHGTVTPPGGDPSRLHGSPASRRLAWPDPRVIRRSLQGQPAKDDSLFGETSR